ncbi:MAG: lytic murein transglycosylase [Candidatus Paceibacterota bacterium]|jgi:peptidoglycan hydrolase CwlO-like protein
MKNTGIFSFIILIMIFGSFSIPNAYSFVDCLKINQNSPESEKNYCRQELARLDAELVDLFLKLEEQKKQTGTIQGDVNYLNAQINALQTKIKARSLAIAQLKISINEKVNKIGSLASKIEREHGLLAGLIRNTNEFDNENLTHLIFSEKGLSDFYSSVLSYSSLRKAIKNSIDVIKGVKTETESEKKSLEEKQNAETNAKVELEESKSKVAQSEAKKKQLLALSKKNESEIAKAAAEKRAIAEKIRAALFPLRDAQAIPFGVALQYAKEAEKITGVRPAFVLAILKQESSLGANVGSCVITNLSTGETKNVNSGKIYTNGIHPTRDLPLLQTIVKELGRDPLLTRVSCPFNVGYGGAMGPAQFIPSTWNLIKNQIAKATSKAVPDPWNPADAIMASSLLLKGNGANAQTYTSEREAACRYYSGKSCSDPTVKNAFYGDAVMNHAKKIQTDIDYLNQYGTAQSLNSGL